MLVVFIAVQLSKFPMVRIQLKRIYRFIPFLQDCIPKLSVQAMAPVPLLSAIYQS